LWRSNIMSKYIGSMKWKAKWTIASFKFCTLYKNLIFVTENLPTLLPCLPLPSSHLLCLRMYVRMSHKYTFYLSFVHMKYDMNKHIHNLQSYMCWCMWVQNSSMSSQSHLLLMNIIHCLCDNLQIICWVKSTRTNITTQVFL